MKNTFSKIRKLMMKNIKYTSLIYLNNTYCMQEEKINLNKNPQPFYLVYNANLNFIPQNINYNRNYAFKQDNANNITNINNSNLNNIEKTKRNINIKNSININENDEILQKEHNIEEKENVFLNKKRERLKKNEKKYCSECFRNENLIDKIFSASLRLIQYNANKLLGMTTLSKKKFTHIDTFNGASKKYDCIKNLFSKNIEVILKKNSDRCISNKNNNEDIIKEIKKSNDQNLSHLKEFLEKNTEDFFKENINVETLTKYDIKFRDFYNSYKEDDQNKIKIKEYTNNFVDNVNLRQTRNRNKNNINIIFKTTKI